MQTKWTYINAGTREVSRDFDTVESWPIGENEIQWAVVDFDRVVMVFFADDLEDAKRFLLSDEAKKEGFSDILGIPREALLD